MIKIGTPEYHFDVQQGSDEWLRNRLGRVTGSEVNSIVTPKGEPASGKAVLSYACQKAAERETQFLEDHFESWDMRRGSLQEEYARDYYSESYEQVAECGFITNTINGVKVGCSPDGLCGEKGGIEIKSRLAKFQVNTIITGEVDDQYLNQCQAFLLISGREWIDFISYSNGLPLFVKRIQPDPIRQESIINALLEFEKIVVDMQKKYASLASSLVQTERVDLTFNNDEIEIIGE